MFDKIAASFGLAKSSWRVLMQDKTLIVFPLISGFCCILIVASFVAPVAFSEKLRTYLIDDQAPKPLLWAVLFLFYFVNFFVVIFFNSALVTCALMRFNGEEPTLSDGLSAAASRLPQILAWALVAATVGIILKLIENAHEKVGAIISGILGTAWSVVTFFVVPVLFVEKTGPIDAVKRSVAIMKKTWGETLIGNFGLGLFTMLLMLPGIALLMLGGFLMGSIAAVGGMVLALGIIYLVIAAAASSALNGIFVSALYEYAARGQIPEQFDRQQVERAFAPKPA